MTVKKAEDLVPGDIVVWVRSDSAPEERHLITKVIRKPVSGMLVQHVSMDRAAPDSFGVPALVPERTALDYDDECEIFEHPELIRHSPAPAEGDAVPRDRCVEIVRKLAASRYGIALADEARAALAAASPPVETGEG